ncbi:VCBS repeat-containing protein [Reichenbachiella sp. MSK19-1]|uniref:FG-GAP repeat domain-containing protein n=1 Tax=Reichenbachiella sp. MSK19-1 TaxID=1897631 RepID=UPI001314828D|nr:VCBS repeat-containing protein [Reichenbachiella sp. MSK19-1]
MTIYTSSAAQTFTELEITAFEPMTDAKAEWADFDADGAPDLFVAGTNSGGSSKAMVYLNNGDDTFNSTLIANWKKVDYAFGDYNRDGYLDILMSGEDGSGDKHLTVFKNNSGASFSEQSLSLTPMSRGGVQWLDFDHDGDLDIAAGGLNSAVEEVFELYEWKDGMYESLAHSIIPLTLGTLKVFDANNDGYHELLLTGFDARGEAHSRVYTVNVDGSTTLYTELSKGYTRNATAISDFNEDGFLDIAFAGPSDSDSESGDLYINNGVSFTQVSPFLQALTGASANFSDLNNDGQMDLLLTGINGSDSYAINYQNNGSPTFSFTSTAHTMEEMYNGQIATVDYEGDGDLDVFQVGNTGFGYLATLYLSDASDLVVDEVPEIPILETDLFTQADSVILEWNGVVDDLTNQNSISYNLYIRSSAGGSDWIVPPLSNESTGYRFQNSIGNAGISTSYTLRSLDEGVYYWSAQAVDGSLKGSVFAAQESFSICYDVSIGNDTTICRYEALPLLISDAAATEVNWYSKTDGLLQADAFSYTHTVDKKDTLIAEVTKSYGCVRYDTLIVSVYDLPVFDIGSDTTICYGEYFALYVSDLGIAGLDSTNWYSTNQGALLLNSETLSFEVLEKDTLIAEVFNMNGCVHYDSLVVSMYDLPAFNLGADTTIVCTMIV